MTTHVSSAPATINLVKFKSYSRSLIFHSFRICCRSPSAIFLLSRPKTTSSLFPSQSVPDHHPPFSWFLVPKPPPLSLSLSLSPTLPPSNHHLRPPMSSSTAASAASEEQTDTPALAPPPSDTSNSKSLLAIQSLYILLGDPLPSSLSSPDLGPPPSLLHDPNLGAKVTSCLRQPLSGAGNDNICRWLYDTFQSADPDLQLAVLRFLPTLAGVYLIRAVARKPLAGFEAVLLALYAHVTKTRSAQPLTVTIPDISHPSLYHESGMKMPTKNSATELSIAVVSPSLEPHGTVRSTRRARIVGVTLELYYSKISQMPVSSKIDFCQFCEVWAGQDGGGGTLKETEAPPSKSEGVEEEEEDGWGKCRNSVKEECGEKGGRIPLPWELLQPSLRILGHCMLGQARRSRVLKEAAWAAVRCLYARALHDLNPQAILATESLLKLGRREMESAEKAAEMDCSIYINSRENLVVFSA